jgi:hypothetical protein
MVYTTVSVSAVQGAHPGRGANLGTGKEGSAPRKGAPRKGKICKRNSVM